MATYDNVDKKKLKNSMDRLWEIYKEMGSVANEVSTWRCPYKNANDRCTAKFGCVNQYDKNVVGELPLCTGSDNLDYKKAWQV